MGNLDKKIKVLDKILSLTENKFIEWEMSYPNKDNTHSHFFHFFHENFRINIRFVNEKNKKNIDHLWVSVEQQIDGLVEKESFVINHKEKNITQSIINDIENLRKTIYTELNIIEPNNLSPVNNFLGGNKQEKRDDLINSLIKDEITEDETKEDNLFKKMIKNLKK